MSGSLCAFMCECAKYVCICVNESFYVVSQYICRKLLGVKGRGQGVDLKDFETMQEVLFMIPNWHACKECGGGG